MLGPHPDDQEPINLYDGRYGPYVKHGEVSASIPKDDDPATVTLEQAVDLLATRRAVGGGRKTKKKPARGAPKARAPKVAKPKTAKKKTVKKKAAKKKAAKKKAARQ